MATRLAIGYITIVKLKDGEKGDRGDKGDKGDRGDDGTNGKDAVEFIVKNAPLVFDTDENGIVPTNAVKTATIEVYRAGKNITSEVKSVSDGNGHVGCRDISIEKGNIVIKATLAGYMILKDSALNVSVTSGYAVVNIVVGSTTYTQQVQFLVNVAKFTGGFMADNKKLHSQYTELTNKVNDIPIKTQSELTQYTSQITQDARRISLEVSTAVVDRRNLLVGSALRKQNEGCRLMRAKILCSQKFEGTNIALADKPQAGGICWGGGYSRNIHVTKGKRYTLTFMARVLSGSADVLCEIRWEKSATDGSHPAGYAGPAGSANLGVEKIQSAEGWHLYQRSFTIPANAAYEWVAVWCVKSNNSTANQQVCFAHPILIEGDAKDYVCWGLSPNDYNYIGGNLLDNTRTFAKAGNLTRMDASVVTNVSYNNGCSVIYANATSKYVEMAQWSVNTIVKKDEDYILSFMAKGSGNIGAYMWNGTNLSIFAEDSEHSTTSSKADGERRLPLTDEWKRYWVHWRSEGTGIPNYVLVRCLQGSKAWVTMPKLETGATPTDWTVSESGYVENSDTVAKILRTGIDIENGKITLDAKNTIVTGNLSLYGTLRRKVTNITKENIGLYVKEFEMGYELSDRFWEEGGGWVNFTQGCLDNYDLGSNSFMIYTPAIGDGMTDAKKDFVRSLVGCQISLYNNSGKMIAISGLCYKGPLGEIPQGFNSSGLPSGSFMHLICTLGSYQRNGKETVAWHLDGGKIL